MNYLNPSLVYIPSTRIVEYITLNPVDWSGKDLAQRGGPGDKAGATPTPAIAEFLNLLLQTGALFTQDEYFEYCQEQWRDWLAEKPHEQRMGVRAKVRRNFYPSMIDSLHVWALASESKRFHSCRLSALEDVVGKSDLILYGRDEVYRIALLIESAKNDRAYKLEYRPHANDQAAIEIAMSLKKPRNPGNKRWYQWREVAEAIYGKPLNQIGFADL